MCHAQSQYNACLLHFDTALLPRDPLKMNVGTIDGGYKDETRGLLRISQETLRAELAS